MMAPKARQQAIVLGVLVVVMAGVYARALRRPAPVSAPAEAPAEAPAAAAPGTAALPEDPELLTRRAEQRAQLAGLTWERDPFNRGPARGRGDLALSGILWDAAKPLAIINGEALQPGQEVDGFRVLSIEPTRVTVSDGTDTLQLQIAP